MKTADPNAAVRAQGCGSGDRTSAGILYALGAFLIWGLSPIYFKAIGTVPPMEILAHRIIWSMMMVGGLLLIMRRPSSIARSIGGIRKLPLYVMTTLLVSANWFLFIWAIDQGFIVESSLGYYINPLVNVLLGVLFLRERLNITQTVAVFIATIGVGVLTIGLGKFPWISLTLAFSFGFYALLRKKADIDPLIGFFVETALLAPIAIIYIAWLSWHGTGSFGTDGFTLDLLLILSGVITAIPLILFMYGAQRLKLSTIGLMQYIAPTCQLMLGVLAYGENFTFMHSIAFASIWIALALYSSNAFLIRRSEFSALGK